MSDTKGDSLHEQAKLSESRRDYLLILHSTLMAGTILLKLFLAVILCFVVAPMTEESAKESRRNHAVILENQALTKEVGQKIQARSQKLEETYEVARRIRTILESLEEKAKQAEERKKLEKEIEDRAKAAKTKDK